MTHEPAWCPVMRPTRQEFQRPFMDYVGAIFAKDPDLPMFKVIPPAGWRPRRTKFPDLKDVKIKTPIRQHVFGTKGAYRCILVEQKEMTVEEFKRQAIDETLATPTLTRKVKSCEDDADADAVLERSFWSGVTLNPPLYGADTPVSFFDPKLPFGWNLRDLGDLLKTKEVPDIPGVTTPMTYFGMWRSFFGWHKEDADLLSINYLHFGAPKTWYCISPKDQAKFERMTQGLFPQLHSACHAFIRHKDILLSPAMLRMHGIPFVQAKQTEGEFIVLNASAYHSGFNLGFNCAEAINFATPAWVETGKQALPCTCRKDAVHLSMKLFDPDWTENSSSDGSDEESSGDSSEEAESDEDGEQEGQETTTPSHRKRAMPAKRQRETSGTRAVSRKVPRRSAAAAEDPQPPANKGSKAATASTAGAKSPGVLPVVGWRAGRGRLAKGELQVTADEQRRLVEREEVVGQPLAIVGEDGRGVKFFCLVQRVQRPATSKGMVVLRWLKEGPDGLYRPVPTYWEERPDALIGVRTQFMPDGLRKRNSLNRGAPDEAAASAASSAGSPPVRPPSRRLEAQREAAAEAAGAGWKLMTLASRILETELME